VISIGMDSPLFPFRHARAILALLGISFTAAAQTHALKGTVESAERPIAGAKVALYEAGQSKTAHGRILATTFSDGAGGFELNFALGNRGGGTGVLYVTAEGNNSAAASRRAIKHSPIALATVLGDSNETPQNFVVNERTTVATAWAMAQFMNGFDISGKSPGLQNAAATVRNLVDLMTGEAGSVLANPPNGAETSTLAEFNSLANLLSVCVSEPEGAACGSLLSLAAPARGKMPSNTLEAALDIAHNPTHNAAALFQLSQSSNEYIPALRNTPDAWVLAVKYVGNGHEFDGPGNMSVDLHGNLWITNNYDGAIAACGGKQLIELTPTGEDAPGAPFSGGGLDGAGFGISIDPKNNIWVGNFGFEGNQCTNHPAANSVSEFTSEGVPVSPSMSASSGGGYTGQGTINGPQATQSDFEGNIWVANFGTLDNTNPGTTITEFVGGDPNQVKSLTNLGLERPFDIAIDAHNTMWVTSRDNNKVVHFAQDSSIIASYSGAAFQSPLGIAIDSLGNAWVTNQTGGSITEIDTHGATHVFQGGGLRGPWGIAIDGNDNVWVANFVGAQNSLPQIRDESVSEFCGARVKNCPAGLKTGDPISPSAGFTSEALQRLTGIVIDPSGNLWVPNNWKRIPIQINPGGDGMVEFIGIAGPVRAPRIGPPQQP
jgi:hypothetical protein